MLFIRLQPFGVTLRSVVGEVNSRQHILVLAWADVSPTYKTAAQNGINKGLH